MTENKFLHGMIISCVGGIYTVVCDNGENVKATARGVFRHEKTTPLAGDEVFLRKEKGSFEINRICERKNILLRPPMANVDTLFVSFAPTEPAPNTLLIDKLLCVTSAAGINAAVVITKCDTSAELTEKYEKIYKNAGFSVFVTSSASGKGVEEIRDFIISGKGGRIYAFAGASGIGKSSLMNALFPALSLKTGALSEKISRGKQTTRTVELFPVENADGKISSFVADTPGFSVLDFSAIHGFRKEELADTFAEFSRYTHECRYRDCTHTKEEECGVTAAVRRGHISKERHDSFLSLYEELAKLPYWK
ncbi:MAG: ribosome small subunit-dependent GTPase A [Eubacteriales bacterium]